MGIFTHKKHVWTSKNSPTIAVAFAVPPYHPPPDSQPLSIALHADNRSCFLHSYVESRREEQLDRTRQQMEKLEQKAKKHDDDRARLRANIDAVKEDLAKQEAGFYAAWFKRSGLTPRPHRARKQHAAQRIT